MRWLVLVVSIFVLAACDSGDDGFPECGGELTLNNARVEGGLVDVADGQELRVVWDEGVGVVSELPAEYYDMVSTYQENETSVEITAEHSGDREITVHFVGLETHMESAVYFTFSLTFPDRRDYAECSHPGSNDTYLVDITLAFDGDRNFTSATFEEHAWLGEF